MITLSNQIDQQIPTLLVAHLHFLADTQSPAKNAKELPSQRTGNTLRFDTDPHYR